MPKFLSKIDHSNQPIDNDTYSLAQANVGAFWTAGKDALKGHLDSGRSLKKSVLDAVDKAGVDAVTDTRT